MKSKWSRTRIGLLRKSKEHKFQECDWNECSRPSEPRMQWFWFAVNVSRRLTVTIITAFAPRVSDCNHFNHIPCICAPLIFVVIAVHVRDRFDFIAVMSTSVLGIEEQAAMFVLLLQVQNLSTEFTKIRFHVHVIPRCAQAVRPRGWSTLGQWEMHELVDLLVHVHVCACNRNLQTFALVRVL